MHHLLVKHRASGFYQHRLSISLILFSSCFMMSQTVLTADKRYSDGFDINIDKITSWILHNASSMSSSMVNRVYTVLGVATNVEAPVASELLPSLEKKAVKEYFMDLPDADSMDHHLRNEHHAPSESIQQGAAQDSSNPQASENLVHQPKADLSIGQEPESTIYDDGQTKIAEIQPVKETIHTSNNAPKSQSAVTKSLRDRWNVIKKQLTFFTNKKQKKDDSASTVKADTQNQDAVINQLAAEPSTHFVLELIAQGTSKNLPSEQAAIDDQARVIPLKNNPLAVDHIPESATPTVATNRDDSNLAAAHEQSVHVAATDNILPAQENNIQSSPIMPSADQLSDQDRVVLPQSASAEQAHPEVHGAVDTLSESGDQLAHRELSGSSNQCAAESFVVSAPQLHESSISETVSDIVSSSSQTETPNELPLTQTAFAAHESNTHATVVEQIREELPSEIQHDGANIDSSSAHHDLEAKPLKPTDLFKQFDKLFDTDRREHIDVSHVDNPAVDQISDSQSSDAVNHEIIESAVCCTAKQTDQVAAFVAHVDQQQTLQETLVDSSVTHEVSHESMNSDLADKAQVVVPAQEVGVGAPDDSTTGKSVASAANQAEASLVVSDDYSFEPWLWLSGGVVSATLLTYKLCSVISNSIRSDKKLVAAILSKVDKEVIQATYEHIVEILNIDVSGNKKPTLNRYQAAMAMVVLEQPNSPHVRQLIIAVLLHKFEMSALDKKQFIKLLKEMIV